MATRTLRPQGGDQGFTLVEVLAAMFVFSLVSIGVLATLTNAAGLTRGNERRVAAAAVAAEELEGARLLAVTTQLTSTTSTRQVGGTTYTVTRSAQLLPQPTSASPCEGSEGRVRALRISVAVDWPGRRGGAPVRSDTLRAIDPDEYLSTGSLAVSVRDRRGLPVANRAVVLNPGAVSRTTDAKGCAVFTDLAPRTDYTVSSTTTNWVGRNGSTSPSRSPITVLKASLTQEELVTDVGVSLRVGFAAQSDYPVPGTVGVSIANPGLRAGVRAYSDCSFVTGGTAGVNCTSSTTPKTLTGLFPFLDGYEVWAGSCAAARPAGPLVARVVGAAPDLTPVTTTDINARVVRVKVRVIEETGTNVKYISGRDVWAVGTTCGRAHFLGKSPSTGWMQVSLPGGHWTVATNSTAAPAQNGKPWPTTTLVVPENLSANPPELSIIG